MAIERIHVLGHPSLPLDIEAYSYDAQVWTCWRFCELLKYLEIPYYYYGVQGSTLPGGGEFVRCAKMRDGWRHRNAVQEEYNWSLCQAVLKHLGCANEIICSMYGAPQDGLKCLDWPLMEPMLGYDHSWTRYRVFPSYAQQNVIYATWPPKDWKTMTCDTIIPHFVNPEEFPLGEGHGDYVLFLGRDSIGKGTDVFRHVAKLCGKEHIEFREEHQGWHGAAKAGLIGNARAVMVPTSYPEPFGFIVIEALMCGTPVITSDWGAFSELVQNGVNGFRCRTMDQYLAAVSAVKTLDRKTIREDAMKKYTIAAVAPAYREFFQYALDDYEKWLLRKIKE